MPASALQEGYDRVASEYTRRIFHELDGKPFDRALLERLAARIGPGRNAPVCDLGCGPGHVARYLHDRGVHVVGVDLSPAMVVAARELSPGITFREGDMRALDAADAGYAGIVAFYSLIHLSVDERAPVLRELHRVLEPGAPLVVAFHIGSQTLHLDEWWGHEVSLDFHFFETKGICDTLSDAGLEIEEVIEREPYPEVEHPSRRAYIIARRPG